jgi:hypothetical protein
MIQPRNPDVSSDRHDRVANAGPSGPKKAYASPRLVQYGSVAKLTHNGAGSVADQKFGMRPSVCL